jgi:hypothetical protein
LREEEALLARLGRSDQHVDTPLRGGGPFDSDRLVDRRPMVPAGQVLLGDPRDGRGRDRRCAAVLCALEEAGLGVDKVSAV